MTRLAGSTIALGLAALQQPRTAGAVWVAEPGQASIPVRIGDLAQAGRELRGGSFDGVSLPGFGGEGLGLAAERAGAQFTSEPLQTQFAATHAAVHWLADGSVATLGVELRSSRDGRAWSAWRPVQIESHGRDLEGQETFGALIRMAGARWLQYRLTFSQAADHDGGIRRVTLTYLDAGTTPFRSDSSRAQSARLGPTDFLSRVISREEWGADESIRFVDGVDQWPRAFVTPKFVAVHHTATDNDYADPAAEVRAIYTYHTVTQGFGDVGYHLLIDNRGQVYEGRRGREPGPAAEQREIVSANVVAGHALGYNYGSIGIAVLGLFTHQPPTSQAMETLEEALAFAATRHGLDPLGRIDFLRARGTAGASTLWRDDLAVISGHRDCVATECPGERLYAELPSLRERLASRVGASGPAVRFTRGPSERDVWPTDLQFAWEGREGAAEFSTRMEGFRLAAVPDLIVPLSGYGQEEELEAWGPWSPSTQASFALPADASGSYTLHVRARDPRGRDLPVQARWPLWVERQALVDNSDRDRTIRVGLWLASSELLAFNGRDYEESNAAAATETFTWRLQAPEAGIYRVLACWADGPNRAGDAVYTVRMNDAIVASTTVDQRERGANWVELALIPLEQEAICQVELRGSASGVVVADAVRLLLTS